MEVAVPSENEAERQQLAVRQAAAIHFLSGILLGSECPPRQATEANLLPSSRRGSEEVQSSPVVEEEKVLANPERVYTEKERATIDFLLNIKLDGDKRRGSSRNNVIPELEDGELSGPVSPNRIGENQPTGTPQNQYVPPTFQIFSGKVLQRHRLSDSRRPSNETGKSINALVDHTVTITTPNGVPMSMFSVIPYRGGKAKPKRQRTKSRVFAAQYLDKFTIQAIDAVKRKKIAASYADLLIPAHTLSSQGVENTSYHPFLLDDPELKIGKHKTVLTLPCFMGSIIQYSKPSDIRKQLNEHFRETHPTVDASITLTKIRKIKEKLLQIALIRDLELSSVASAYVYFEKLVLKQMVNKVNRRLVAAVCLLLACKVNDPKELNYARLLETAERYLEVQPKEVYAHEFSVYAALDFTLFLPLWEILPHLERIVDASSYSSVEEYTSGRTFFYHGF